LLLPSCRPISLVSKVNWCDQHNTSSSEASSKCSQHAQHPKQAVKVALPFLTNSASQQTQHNTQHIRTKRHRVGVVSRPGARPGDYQTQCKENTIELYKNHSSDQGMHAVSSNTPAAINATYAARDQLTTLQTNRNNNTGIACFIDAIQHLQQAQKLCHSGHVTSKHTAVNVSANSNAAAVAPALTTEEKDPLPTPGQHTVKLSCQTCALPATPRLMQGTAYTN
jgi:hypothetical protein